MTSVGSNFLCGHRPATKNYLWKVRCIANNWKFKNAFTATVFGHAHSPEVTSVRLRIVHNVQIFLGRNVRMHSILGLSRKPSSQPLDQVVIYKAMTRDIALWQWREWVWAW